MKNVQRINTTVVFFPPCGLNVFEDTCVYWCEAGVRMGEVTEARYSQRCSASPSVFSRSDMIALVKICGGKDGPVMLSISFPLFFLLQQVLGGNESHRQFIACSNAGDQRRSEGWREVKIEGSRRGREWGLQTVWRGLLQANSFCVGFCAIHLAPSCLLLRG